MPSSRSSVSCLNRAEVKTQCQSYQISKHCFSLQSFIHSISKILMFFFAFLLVFFLILRIDIEPFFEIRRLLFKVSSTRVAQILYYLFILTKGHLTFVSEYIFIVLSMRTSNRSIRKQNRLWFFIAHKIQLCFGVFVGCGNVFVI